MEKKSISVVIPNYNGRQLLTDYLPHTYEALRKAETDYEIIVVDDCSTDDSAQYLKQYYPDVNLIENVENKGFSFSCNQGIAEAKFELIFLLNSDVKLSTDYFTQQFKYFSSEDTFGVMGRIIDMEGDNIQDAGRVPKFHGFKLKTDFYYSADTGDQNYSLYLSGANALVDAQKIKALGGFNEMFSPFYGEDLELSLRAWRLGWKCYYEHQSICRHKTSASTNTYKTPKWVKRIYYRNRFYVHAIHLNRTDLIFWFLQITFIDLVPKLLAGNFWMWKSYRDLLKHWRCIKKSRSEFNRVMRLQGQNTSFNEVVETIKDSIRNKRIVKF